MKLLQKFEMPWLMMIGGSIVCLIWWGFVLGGHGVCK